MEKIEKKFEARLPPELAEFKLVPLLDKIVEYLITVPNPQKKSLEKKVTETLPIDRRVFQEMWDLIREACTDLLSTVHCLEYANPTDEQLTAFVMLEYFYRHRGTSRYHEQLKKMVNEKTKSWILSNIDEQKK